MTATKKQIEDWKKEHGKIFHLKAGSKSCYLKKPSRKALSYAATAGVTDIFKYNEIILKDCWLDGDMEIQTDNGLFLSISNRLPEIIEMVEFELVKL